jgi:hypothetical protein
MTTDPNEIPHDPQEPINPGAYRPYGEPPYGAPPPPTGAAGPYGAPPPTGGAYAYAAPTGAPVPAGIGAIWQKWLNVTTRPGVASFARELPTANWRDIWLSLIGLGILSAITGAIAALYTGQTITIPRTDGTTTTWHIPAGSSWFAVISVPLAFFIGVAILFVVAKLFGGTGTFLEQSYAMALFYVPIQAVVAILGLVPFFGSLAAFVLGIYEIVLAVFAIAASQRLSTGRSVAVVLLPAAILLLLSCGLIVLFIAVIATAVNGAH